jgi:asparagine synthetase B (glutamine-hydrolysing)
MGVKMVLSGEGSDEILGGIYRQINQISFNIKLHLLIIL